MSGGQGGRWARTRERKVIRTLLLAVVLTTTTVVVVLMGVLLAAAAAALVGATAYVRDRPGAVGGCGCGAGGALLLVGHCCC
ncbi:MAG: hypothetical protein RSB04_02010 [Gordonibacter sp.]|uniref:hypothetical protein n=1 Tax=Gordonibacter sp. TaxID=1968902 RepID=UPI002FC97DA1